MVWSRAILADVRHVDSMLAKLGSQDGKVLQQGHSGSPASGPNGWSILSFHKEQLISLAFSNTRLKSFTLLTCSCLICKFIWQTCLRSFFSLFPAEWVTDVFRMHCMAKVQDSTSEPLTSFQMIPGVLSIADKWKRNRHLKYVCYGLSCIFLSYNFFLFFFFMK